MWAERAELSHLVTPERLRETLEEVGFELIAWNDLTALHACATPDRRWLRAAEQGPEPTDAASPGSLTAPHRTAPHRLKGPC
ncbi:hypothetical protein [Streptomyces sp. NBC_01497]|uniref:hypothetical protein n=1 Tax=Streptomyces sp. NBC_01497 TaxID=2903885 RepID=UPI002E33C451|nr:hypothetical protein [Streptomyces sp. NBC_01497]